MRFSRRALPAIALATLVLLSSCAEPGPEALRYGEDVCDYCRMTIVEQNFGSELVTNKAKIYKFDSIECLAAFEADDRIVAEEVHSMWVTDFQDSPSLVNTSQAHFVHTDHARSPMGMGLFGFSSSAAAESHAEQHQGKVVAWADLVRIVAEAWKIRS